MQDWRKSDHYQDNGLVKETDLRNNKLVGKMKQQWSTGCGELEIFLRMTLDFWVEWLNSGGDTSYVKEYRKYYRSGGQHNECSSSEIQECEARES